MNDTYKFGEAANSIELCLMQLSGLPRTLEVKSSRILYYIYSKTAIRSWDGLVAYMPLLFEPLF